MDCYCVKSSEDTEVFFQLGYAKNLDKLRIDFASKLGVPKIEDVNVFPCVFSDKPGPTTEEGCPLPYLTISKGVEKFLIVAKEREGHICEARYIVLAIIEWEFLPEEKAIDLHTNLKRLSQQFVAQLPRGCAQNRTKSCECNKKSEGFSASFGCGRHKFEPICKFARSKPENISKFKSSDPQCSTELASVLNNLADHVAQHLLLLAPEAHRAMCPDGASTSCRIGNAGKKPFSSVTLVSDFSAHTHKDRNNVDGGATAVVTLRPKGGKLDKNSHVLPDFRPARAFAARTGGLTFNLPSGSLLIEVAKLLKHATTAVNAEGSDPRPCRIGVVFYQHQHLNLRHHGKCEAEKRSFERLQVLVAKYREGNQLGKIQMKKVQKYLKITGN